MCLISRACTLGTHARQHIPSVCSTFPYPESTLQIARASIEGITSSHFISQWPCFWLADSSSSSSSFPSYVPGVHHFGWNFCVCDYFFSPTIEVVTFHLCGWCMLGVFVTGIHPSRIWMLGSFESVRWNACVHRWTAIYALIRKSFGGMESEPMLTPREKSHLPEKFSEKDQTHNAAWLADSNLLQEDAKPLKAVCYSATRRLKGHAPALMLVTRAAHEAAW